MALTKVIGSGVGTVVSPTLTTAIVTSDGGAATRSLVQGTIKAWNRIEGKRTAVVYDDFGFSGITDGGEGRYASTFTSAMANVNYAISVTGDIGSGGRFFGIIKATSDTTKVNTVIYLPDAAFDDADPTMMLVAGDLA